jgi:hypothetical protein
VKGYHPGGPPWWTQVDATTLEVAEALGLPVVRRSCACPACGAERRSSRNRGDRRGPVGFTPDGNGWRCHRCEAGGSALDLAAWKLTGRAWQQGDRESAALLRSWCADRGWCEPAPGSPRKPHRRPERPPVPEPQPEALHPPGVEVGALWRACGTIDAAGVEPSARWLQEARGIDVQNVAELDLARVLGPPTALRGPFPECIPSTWDDWPPYPFPRWLPAAWWPLYRLVLPTWTPKGSVGSVRLRCPGDPGGGKPKERAPKGVSAKGLTLADPVGLSLLCGRPDPCWDGSVVVSEGCPDFLTWAARRWRGKRYAVLGVWPGSWTDDLAARIPTGSRVAIRTHNDPAGDRMAATITKTLAGRVEIHRKCP